MSEVFRQYEAMVQVLSHMAAGYKVYIEAFGWDGSDGYRLDTEKRSTGEHVVVTGKTIPAACELLAEKLR